MCVCVCLCLSAVYTYALQCTFYLSLIYIYIYNTSFTAIDHGDTIDTSLRLYILLACTIYYIALTLSLYIYIYISLVLRVCVCVSFHSLPRLFGCCTLVALSRFFLFCLNVKASIAERAHDAQPFPPFMQFLADDKGFVFVIRRFRDFRLSPYYSTLLLLLLLLSCRWSIGGAAAVVADGNLKHAPTI